MSEESRWVTCGALERRFRVTRTTVHRWIHAGYFSRWRRAGPRGDLEVEADAVEAFASKHFVEHRNDLTEVTGEGGPDAA